MAINKIVFGQAVLLDTSGVTVTPETLAEGATALDKTGSTITGTMTAGIDTADATATASDIRSGRTAYVKGKKITGTISSNQNGIGSVDQIAGTATSSGILYVSFTGHSTHIHASSTDYSAKITRANANTFYSKFNASAAAMVTAYEEGVDSI